MGLNKGISINDYDYDLPQDRIAYFPLPERDNSFILIRDKEGNISKDIFKNISEYLPDSSNLVFNNSRVIPARVRFPASNGSFVEIFCLEPVEPDNYREMMQKKGDCMWRCMIGNKKHFRKILPKKITLDNGTSVVLEVFGTENEGLTSIVDFHWDDPAICFGDIISHAGITPLPPYIKREAENIDRIRYQTVYSKVDGSVAAPTAGLHFTGKVIHDLKRKNIKMLDVTLHVSAGTFLPVKSQYISEHKMHSEFFSVTREFIEAFSDIEGPVIAVGTTALRTLESLYWIGVMLNGNVKAHTDFLFLDQWEPYRFSPALKMKEAFSNLIRWLDHRKLDSLDGRTRMMILPGYDFQVADAVITNFHQPKSTLLLLIAAFIGDPWKDLYRYALDNNFRFLSYGDSSLLWRPGF